MQVALKSNNILIIGLFLMFFQFLNAQTAPSNVDAVCKDFSNHEHLRTNLVETTSENTKNYDLIHYNFHWKINPNENKIEGKVIPTFKVISQLGLNEIYFDFSNSLVVSEVLYHGEKLTFSQAVDFELKINLPNNIKGGTLDSLSISYSGTPVGGGLGSFVQSEHNETPVIWTLSEPYGAQDWWPCKNGLDDKIDSFDVYVTCPKNNKVASNGKLITINNVGDKEVAYHWKTIYPTAAYLVAIAVTNYETYEDQVTFHDGFKMPIVNYVYPENLTEAKQGTAALVKVLHYFDSLFVSYPFRNEKYGHAQFGWGGGMEHQTMSFVINYGFNLCAHELAHQWFGDMVTCGSWEDIWLNEGFATYCTGLAINRFMGASSFFNWKSSSRNSIVSSPNGSVFVNDTTNINRIFSSRLSYNKGAWLLTMLRWKIGDDAFFSAIRAYLNDRSYQFSKTKVLQNFLELESGVSLDEFFKDWFKGEGFPTYQITWGATKNRLDIQVDQTTSNATVDFFEMPLQFRLRGELPTQDTLIRLNHTENNQLFNHIPVSFKVETIEFDPNLYILSGENTIENNLIIANNDLKDYPFRIYPNPASQHINIELDIRNIQFEYEILNSNGKVVLKGTTKNDRVNSIDIRSIQSGVYFVQLATKEGKSLTQKFVKN